MNKIASMSIASLSALLSLAPAAHAATPNDAQIAAIVVAANTVDVDAGKQAESKTSNKDVRAFAEQMVADHTSVNEQATALVQKLHVTPEENATSKTLRQDGATAQTRIGKLSGKSFDKAYVANEVKYHQTVIDALDKTLIPSASNAELKALLVKARPTFIEHLAHAKHLQAELK
jgi:putative membrane protein